MEKFFPGYYPLDGVDSNKLWNEGFIVFDSSFLLGLFQLKPADRDSIMNILEKKEIKAKLWIPYDVAWVYHRFLNDVLLRQIETIRRLQVLINEILAILNNKACYPYFEEDIIQTTTSLFEKVNEVCCNQITEHKDALYSCVFKNRIKILFKDRIGSAYNSAQLEELYKQGQSRYDKRIPPGYASVLYTDQRLRYHSYIVWEQLKKQAQDTRKNIILCTGQVTEDWFYLVDGEPVISNCQLVNEFQAETHKSFRCYSMQYFLDECKDHGLISETERNSVANNLSVSYDFSPRDSASTTAGTSSVS